MGGSDADKLVKEKETKKAAATTAVTPDCYCNHRPFWYHFCLLDVKVAKFRFLSP